MAKIIDVRGAPGSGAIEAIHEATGLFDHHELIKIKGGRVVGQQVAVNSRQVAVIADGAGYYWPSDRAIENLYTCIANYDVVILNTLEMALSPSYSRECGIECVRRGHDYIFYFIDTPQDVCVQQVWRTQREPSVSDIRSMHLRLHNVVSSRLRIAGLDVRTLSHKTAAQTLLEEVCTTAFKTSTTDSAQS